MIASSGILHHAGVLDEKACQRVVNARDPRFDGLFFVAITTTGIYCRPICPARVTYPERRRFYRLAAEAERAGYRPCLRCRPELAPGRALCDAVSRLAFAAVHRIAGGALNGRSVAALARELCVSERHLRRALEREFGVSPVELAQTHRLLLAKQLLTDTELPVTRIAYASGFQSLRRFNAAFREHYRMAPTALRRTRRKARPAEPGDGARVRVTLSYRAPLAWRELLDAIAHTALAGVEVVDGPRLGRTVRMDGATGFVFVEKMRPLRDTHLHVAVSESLVPALMPLLARIRQMLDLDAEPTVIDAHLRAGGLGAHVALLPGLRIPGALDGFEAALRTLPGRGRRGRGVTGRIVATYGDPIETGVPGLSRLAPTAERIADVGVARLAALGMALPRAAALHAVAVAVAESRLVLERGQDPDRAARALMDLSVPGRVAQLIVMRAMQWPDTIPVTDRALQRAVGLPGAEALARRAEHWRPWRSYAALHLYRAAAPESAMRAAAV